MTYLEFLRVFHWHSLVGFYFLGIKETIPQRYQNSGNRIDLSDCIGLHDALG